MAQERRPGAPAAGPPGAPPDADDREVAQQQPVHPDLGDRPGGEADDEQPPAGCERAQRVGEAVAADRVDHDVDPATAGEARDGIAEAVGEHDLVGAGRPGHLRLVVRRDHRDDPGAPGGGQLHRGGADAAGRAVHEHGLAVAQPAALAQGEVAGEVVHRQRRALLEGRGVGQREDHRGVHLDDLGEPAEEGERRHPVALGEAAPGRCRAHQAGHLGPRHEGQVGRDLVLPAGQQDVGEADARRRDLDDHPGTGGFGELDHLHGIRSVEPGHLGCAHARHRRDDRAARRAVEATGVAAVRLFTYSASYLVKG